MLVVLAAAAASRHAASDSSGGLGSALQVWVVEAAQSGGTRFVGAWDSGAGAGGAPVGLLSRGREVAAIAHGAGPAVPEALRGGLFGGVVGFGVEEISVLLVGGDPGQDHVAAGEERFQA